MYNVIFEADTGKKFVFGAPGSNVFDMNIGDGLTVSIGTSQGFAQIGESVESQSVTGRHITVRGVVFGDVPQMKRTMRNTFAPFVSGRLVFGKSHYIRVYVKASPTFSPVKNDGRFTMQFFAPFPYFYSMSEKTANVGAIIPQFRFPVNYSTPHRFGTRTKERYTNIYNGGDVAVPFDVHLTAAGECPNVTVTNMKNLAFLKVNGTLNTGDSMRIYRDSSGILRAELTSEGLTTDAISMIDEESTLFQLTVGDNLIGATDDNDGANLTASFAFREAVVAVYES